MINKISIVIPTSNRNKLLFRTLNSINIDVPSLTKIIIVDDCSIKPVDRNIINKFPKLSIKLIRLNKSCGASHARNIGANFVDTKWIAFFDDDDFWLPGRYKHFLKIINKRQNLNLIISSAICLSKIFFIQKIRFLKPDLMKLKKFNSLGGCSSLLIKKDFFDSIKGFDTKLNSCQDWDLYYRAHKLITIKLDYKPTILYIQHKNSISGNFNKIYRGRKSFYFKHKNDFDKSTIFHHLLMLKAYRTFNNKKLFLENFFSNIYLLRFLSLPTYFFLSRLNNYQ